MYCQFLKFYFLSVIIFTFNAQKLQSTDDVSETIKKIYLADPDRAGPKDIVLNYQMHSKSPKKDLPKEPLFKSVKRSLEDKPVYKKFSALFDNYEPYTGHKEIDNSEKKKEIDDFLNYVFKSVVFTKTFQFLKSKGNKHATNKATFEKFFRQLWFGQYSRKAGVLDSSAFEHVFVGEILKKEKGAEVGGLHNWFRFYQLEKSGLANYAGFVLKRRNLITMIRFEWLNVWKPSGSFIIGSSPQFDMCAYTICFLLKPGKETCQFDLDGCSIKVTSHELTRKQDTFIGSAFPSPGPAC